MEKLGKRKRGRFYFLEDSFGEAIIGPRTLRGDRGLFTQMRIGDPHSLNLVRNDPYGPNTKETKYVLERAVKGGFLPKTKLKHHWSRK